MSERDARADETVHQMDDQEPGDVLSNVVGSVVASGAFDNDDNDSIVLNPNLNVLPGFSGDSNPNVLSGFSGDAAGKYTNPNPLPGFSRDVATAIDRAGFSGKFSGISSAFMATVPTQPYLPEWAGNLHYVYFIFRST